jgi:hypothetical protein
VRIIIVGGGEIGFAPAQALAPSSDLEDDRTALEQFGIDRVVWPEAQLAADIEGISVLAAGDKAIVRGTPEGCTTSGGASPASKKRGGSG